MLDGKHLVTSPLLGIVNRLLRLIWLLKLLVV